jgi:hypothetical protein
MGRSRGRSRSPGRRRRGGRRRKRLLSGDDEMLTMIESPSDLIPRSLTEVYGLRYYDGTLLRFGISSFP